MVKSLIDPDGRYAPLIEPIIAEEGYRLVRVILTNKPREGQILQIMVEPDTKTDLNLDNCAAISRAIGTLFEVEDPVPGAYRLEVSSPGVDRPLTRWEDFEHYTDYEIRVELDMPIETGQKKFRGILKRAEDKNILIESEHEEFLLPFDHIKKSSLVMNDALIEATMKKKQKAS